MAEEAVRTSACLHILPKVATRGSARSRGQDYVFRGIPDLPDRRCVGLVASLFGIRGLFVHDVGHSTAAGRNQMLHRLFRACAKINADIVRILLIVGTHGYER